MSGYGYGGEADALCWLNLVGTGEHLTDADKAAMFAAGYMDNEFKPTAKARQAYADRKLEGDLYVAGRVTAGANHLVSNRHEANDGFGDPHLSEVVNLGHGAGVVQPRFPAQPPVTYHANDGDYPEQMQGSILDCGMDTILPRWGRG